MSARKLDLGADARRHARDLEGAAKVLARTDADRAREDALRAAARAPGARVTCATAVVSFLEGNPVRGDAFEDEAELGRFLWWLALAPVCRRKWAQA